MKIYFVLTVLVAFLMEKETQAAGTVQYTVYNNYGPGVNNGTLLVKLMRSLLAELRKTNVGTCPNNVAKNCYEVLKCGGTKSGVYSVDPDGKGEFKVFCDQKTSGGGWTVFQRRKDGSVDFYRGWIEYKDGFGDLNGEFWLGLDKINRLTHPTRNCLRVDLMDTAGKTAYAEFNYFAVAGEWSQYKLSVGSYSGTAGDSLTGHRDMAFSTKDRDNDIHSANCAVAYKGAWWYNKCHGSNLNGLYHHGAHKSSADGVNWYTWKGHNYSAKKAEMKIRPCKKRK